MRVDSRSYISYPQRWRKKRKNQNLKSKFDAVPCCEYSLKLKPLMRFHHSFPVQHPQICDSKRAQLPPQSHAHTHTKPPRNPDIDFQSPPPALHPHSPHPQQTYSIPWLLLPPHQSTPAVLEHQVFQYVQIHPFRLENPGLEHLRGRFRVGGRGPPR